MAGGGGGGGGLTLDDERVECRGALRLAVEASGRRADDDLRRLPVLLHAKGAAVFDGVLRQLLEVAVGRHRGDACIVLVCDFRRLHRGKIGVGLMLTR